MINSFEKIISSTAINDVDAITIAIIMIEALVTLSRSGQLTLFSSTFVSEKKPLNEDFDFSTAFDFIYTSLSIFLFTVRLAGSVGFEPTTFGFGDRRSTNWSYEPKLFGFLMRSM